ncbi:MAG: TonB family protein [Proteiniphilum sp.]|nr:TonB family protein [Proteiniphilum sp.]
MYKSSYQRYMITREKIAAAIGTILFTVLLFLILLFSVFTFSFPPEELEGIPVMFGSTPDAFGTHEPPMTEVVATPTPTQAPAVPPHSPVIPSNSPAEPLITQTTEPTIDVEAEKEEERRREQAAAERRAQEEALRRRNEEEAKKRQINQQMSGLFGESSGSRGNTQGEGVQGVSTGNSTQGATSGTGGIGTYDLGGRSLRGSGGLIQPNYTVNDEGKVVVNITVDPEGNVIHAEIGSGTNTGNTTLRNEAMTAAKRTKFNAITSGNNQKGTITYNFRLR